MNPFTIIHLLHIFVIGTFLLYIGIRQKNLSNMWYWIMIAVGLTVIAYHSYKFFTVKQSWVSLFHMFFIAPLLVITGYLGENAPRYLFELILMSGFAAIGYHAYAIYAY